MARVEGPVVAALQGVAAENWLECCGEILTGPEYFPNLEPVGNTTAFVIKSSPSDRATASRVAFQLLMEGADHHVRIQTPYFLPDRALRKALIAVARRGVAVSVIVPGRITDQRWVRLASRRMWGNLLRAGVRIHEYRPAMTHAKVLIVDELWSVLGTTNIDNRSFEHNDEINLAMRDPEVAARLLRDYERDLTESDEVTLGGMGAPAAVGEDGRSVRMDPGAAAVTDKPSKHVDVRIATYNIHRCRGMDRRTIPARIADVIRELNADVVALQEVIGAGPSGVDQAEEIGAALGMGWVMHSVRQLRQHQFGNVVLSRYPIVHHGHYDLSWRDLRGARVPAGRRGFW